MYIIVEPNVTDEGTVIIDVVRGPYATYGEALRDISREHPDSLVFELVPPAASAPVVPHEDAKMELTVQQALELSTLLVTAVQEFCQRRDVSDALHRTTPLVMVES